LISCNDFWRIRNTPYQTFQKANTPCFECQLYFFVLAWEFRGVGHTSFTPFSNFTYDGDFHLGASKFASSCPFPKNQENGNSGNDL
jgi:hypothetical protein